MFKGFERLPEIPFDPAWRQETGYFNGAVCAEIEQISRSNSGPVNNRNLILFPTPSGGNLVVFERYTGGTPEIYVCNTPYLGPIKFAFSSALTTYEYMWVENRINGNNVVLEEQIKEYVKFLGVCHLTPSEVFEAVKQCLIRLGWEVKPF